MAGKSTAVIFLFLISLAGLGLGGYTFYDSNFGSSSQKSGNVLVGLWEDVTKNKLHPIMNADSAWLLEVSNEQIVNNEYIFLNQTTGYKDTRFHFIKTGLYRITININLVDLNPTQGYAMDAFKDGENYGMNGYKHIYHVVTPNAGEHVNVDFYLESDGTNFYEFGCYTIAAPFDIASDQKYNHLAIEYVNQ
jgi:hypothetical protein